VCLARSKATPITTPTYKNERVAKTLKSNYVAVTPRAVEDEVQFFSELLKNSSLRTGRHQLESDCEKVEVSSESTTQIFSGLEAGLVVSYKDGVVVATGLPSLRINELVFFRNGATGVALNLEINLVKALVFSDVSSLRAGEFIYASGFLLRINVGEALLGRVIDPLGVPLDGRGDIESYASFPIERKAPGVITRKKVSQPLHTGIRIIDSLVPIGRGQRELILGDRKTGKTSIILDTFINQT